MNEFHGGPLDGQKLDVPENQTEYLHSDNGVTVYRRQSDGSFQAEF